MYEEFVNYLYFFEVYETQDISFKVTLNVVSGDADLYLSPCKSISSCIISKDNVNASEVEKIENTQSLKTISKNFTCKNEK